MENPTIENIIEAYNVARQCGADSTCKVLETLYPNVDFTPRDNRPVTDRIKTFEDACDALGEDNPLVMQWKWLHGCEVDDTNMECRKGTFTDILALLKLRIIVAALNEGWEPEFSDEELRWEPWFVFYTKEELDAKSEDWKQSRTILPLDGRVVGRSSNNAVAHGGLVCAYASNASSVAYTYGGARLAFKSEELAVYAGKQFIEIYADFILAR